MPPMLRARACGPALLALFAGSLGAQTFDDLNLVRDRPLPFASLIQVKAGVIGAQPDTSDPAAGLESELGWDGHLYFRDDDFGGGPGRAEAYAGRDGALASLQNGNLVGGETYSRLELKARYFPFWREGYYRGRNFVPVGRYEGRDYEAYLGFGKPAGDGLLLELGGFFRRNTFDRSDDTAATFLIPDDHSAYGARLFAEHKTLNLDRRRGVPRDGFLLTAMAEREWNRSERVFGEVPLFTSELPSAFWRGRGHLEWFFPGSDDITWVVVADGQLTASEDRIYNYEAQKPQGHQWADAQFRMRWFLGERFVVTPFVAGQYVRLLDQTRVTSDKKFFFGGGVEADFLISEAVSINAWYSYLNNESRPPVLHDEDVHGEHMFFLGAVLRFGGRRR